MRGDVPPTLLVRAYKKFKGLALSSNFRRYKAMIGPHHPFRDFLMRNIGDASEDPTERFDHYDAFAFWAANRICSKETRLAILDIGSIKMMNAIMSITNDVTSIVLADCGDEISNVRYVRHDVSDALPFPDNSFDVLTSMASLNLVGLGRYRDKLNPYCLPNLVNEMHRTLRPRSMVLISMCLGPNVLQFNNGWFLDMDTIVRVFSPWTLMDYLVDNESSPRNSKFEFARRFVKDSGIESTNLGDYRVIFLHFER